MEKILIETRGGVIQSVYSSLDLEVEIVDYDCEIDKTNQEIEDLKGELKVVY